MKTANKYFTAKPFCPFVPPIIADGQNRSRNLQTRSQGRILGKSRGEMVFSALMLQWHPKISSQGPHPAQKNRLVDFFSRRGDLIRILTKCRISSPSRFARRQHVERWLA